jgi:hypothetical protein
LTLAFDKPSIWRSSRPSRSVSPRRQPERRRIPDDVGADAIIHFASVAFAAIRRVCVDLGGEIDSLRERCAALESRS